FGITRAEGVQQFLSLFLVAIQAGAKRQWLQFHYENRLTARFEPRRSTPPADRGQSDSRSPRYRQTHRLGRPSCRNKGRTVRANPLPWRRATRSRNNPFAADLS